MYKALWVCTVKDGLTVIKTDNPSMFERALYDKVKMFVPFQDKRKKKLSKKRL